MHGVKNGFRRKRNALDDEVCRICHIVDESSLTKDSGSFIIYFERPECCAVIFCTGLPRKEIASSLIWVQKCTFYGAEKAFDTL